MSSSYVSFGDNNGAGFGEATTPASAQKMKENINKEYSSEEKEYSELIKRSLTAVEREYFAKPMTVETNDRKWEVVKSVAQNPKFLAPAGFVGFLLIAVGTAALLGHLSVGGPAGAISITAVGGSISTGVAAMLLKRHIDKKNDEEAIEALPSELRQKMSMEESLLRQEMKESLLRREAEEQLLKNMKSEEEGFADLEAMMNDEPESEGSLFAGLDLTPTNPLLQEELPNIRNLKGTPVQSLYQFDDIPAAPYISQDQLQIEAAFNKRIEDQIISLPADVRILAKDLEDKRYIIVEDKKNLTEIFGDYHVVSRIGSTIGYDKLNGKANMKQYIKTLEARGITQQ